MRFARFFECADTRYFRLRDPQTRIITGFRLLFTEMGCWKLDFANLTDFFSLLSQAVVVERDGQTVFKNDSCEVLFPGVDPLGELLSPKLIEACRPGVNTCFEYCAEVYRLTTQQIDDYRIFIIAKEKSEDDKDFDFLATVNEAMRSPLATLSAAANLMTPVVEGLENEALTRNLAVIYNNYFRLLRLSNNISGFAELRAHKTKLDIKCVDLLSLCRNLVDTVSLLTKERGVRLWFRTTLPSAYSPLDFEKIERVLLNLLSNSLSHTQVGDDITVDVSRASEYFVITVSDTGTGIAPGVVSSLFEPRLTRKALSDPEQGLGMGLAYSRFLISEHGGSMVIESSVHKGTTVKFTLPVCKFSDKLSDKPVRYGDEGMLPVLTELSDVLSLDCFSAKYLD